jgi:hypothetical protein
MNFKTSLGLAGVVAGAVCLGVLAITVPQPLWTSDGVGAAMVLFLSFASPAFLATATLRRDAKDATSISLIGPLGKLWLLLLLVASTALRASFIGWHRASWAICLLWGGLCIVGFVVLNASSKIVADASSQTRIANTDARTQWAQLLLALQAQVADDGLRSLLEHMVDKVRFAANESAGQAPRENQEINALFGKLQASLGKPDEIANLLHSAETMLDQREQTLRAGRTRA